MAIQKSNQTKVDEIKMNDTNGLPKGWKAVKLGEVGEIISGGTPSTKVPEYWNGKISWITPADLSGYTEKFISKGRKSISKSGLKNSSARLMPKGSVLFSSRAPIGYVVIAGYEICTNQGFKSVIPSEDVSSEYLYYFLKASKHNAEKVASGTTFKEISLKSFANLDFPLPPLPVQQRIVEKIEELFSEVEDGVASLRQAKGQLKTYRQAVLKWAFEGKLTRGAGADLTTFKKLSNLPAADFNDDRDLPEGWEWKKTSEVIETINNGYTPKSQFLTQGSGEVPFIKVYNLNFDGTLNYEKNPTFIPKSIHKKDLARSICYPGDVLTNIVGPPLGKVSIVSDEYPEWNINQAIVLFRPNKGIISRYISYFLQNPRTIHWLEGTSKATAGQYNIKVSTCREIPIPICPVDEQKQVVQEIESRLSVADKLEESINHSLQQAEALKQSILKRAFEGRLVGGERFDNFRKVVKSKVKSSAPSKT